MHRWQVGDVEIVRIEDLDFAVPSDSPVPEWCVPDLAPTTDQVGIAFSALALAADGQRIVVDPWMANDGPRAEPDARDHAERLLAELSAAGFPADEVDVVVNTHLDGVGWNSRPTSDGWQPSFPNARYLYPAAELAALEAGQAIEGDAAFAELARLVDIEAVHPPNALTPSVSLDDAPGHNWGHLAVRVERAGALAIYPGHLVLTPFDIADPARADPDDPQHAVAVVTRRRLLDELAERQGLLLTTLLGGSGAGTVHRDGTGFRLGS
jgi:glyoxylase-like metal-dependent hydrolase (beta-lactamase superfamily II)